MAYKQERLEKIIEKEISNILQSETKDERLKFVTITKVSLTGDLSIATVYYTVLGTDSQKEATTKNLLNAKGFIRSTLGGALDIRRIPDLKFKYDNSQETGDRIEQILKDINKPY